MTTPARCLVCNSPNVQPVLGEPGRLACPDCHATAQLELGAWSWIRPPGPCHQGDLPLPLLDHGPTCPTCPPDEEGRPSCPPEDDS